MKNLNNFLTNYKVQEKKYFENFFTEKLKESKGIDPEIEKAVQVFKSYSSGGKKIRGALTFLGHNMIAKKNDSKVIPVSCGIELLHNFLLIHDDIIDKDEVRRGVPTVHATYKGELGISKAIVIGDMGAFWGYEMIVGSGFAADKVSLALKLLNSHLLRTAYGQLLDIEFDSHKKITYDEVYKVRLYKTAYYTIVMPLSIGAALAGASKKTLASIEEFGTKLGIAFQLADDVLGVFGDEGKTGKSATSDIRVGKKTLLYAKALDMSNGDNLKFLLSRYGAENLTDKDILKLKSIIKDSGSLEFSLNMAKKLSIEAESLVPKLTSDDTSRKILVELCNYIVTRSS